MKNLALFVIAVMAMGSLLFTATSCDKEEVSTAAKIDTTKMATITGIAMVNTDVTNDTTQFGAAETQYEAPPAGTKISVRIDFSDYDFDGDLRSSGSGYKVYEVTTSSDGSYSVTIPATSEGVTIELYPADFVADYITEVYDADEGEMVKVSEREVFEASKITVSTVLEGQTRIKDIMYSMQGVTK